VTGWRQDGSVEYHVEGVLWADGSNDDRPARLHLLVTCSECGRQIAFKGGRARLADLVFEAEAHHAERHGGPVPQRDG
jgi:hypothetical protein